MCTIKIVLRQEGVEDVSHVEEQGNILNKLISIEKNPQIKEKISFAAKKTVENLTWKENAERVKIYFERIINDSTKQ